jgi:hypothetical protein
MSRDDRKEAAMATIKAVDFERSGIGKGIKTAALVLALTAGAVVADHVFFTPSEKPAASPMTVQAAPVNAPAPDGFALPEHLRRPTAADEAAPPPTF